ncbi:MAG: hypothetical protein JWR13_1035 [Mycobacterium sp.]|nr:hypothetical protein [Mycobacterium sp.]
MSAVPSRSSNTSSGTSTKEPGAVRPTVRRRDPMRDNRIRRTTPRGGRSHRRGRRRGPIPGVPRRCRQRWPDRPSSLRGRRRYNTRRSCRRGAGAGPEVAQQGLSTAASRFDIRPHHLDAGQVDALGTLGDLERSGDRFPHRNVGTCVSRARRRHDRRRHEVQAVGPPGSTVMSSTPAASHRATTLAPCGSSNADLVTSTREGIHRVGDPDEALADSSIMCLSQARAAPV